MIKREIEISGKKVPFRSSATIPRLYRAKFKRDIFKDLSKLEKSYRGKTENGEELQIEDLEIFENVAYVMAYHADNSIPANIEDWLDQFDMFSIYEVLPQILELWGENLVTDVTLRSVELGISIRDLDLLTIGLVLDMWTEKSNDGVKYKRLATQEDFDKF